MSELFTPCVKLVNTDGDGVGISIVGDKLQVAQSSITQEVARGNLAGANYVLKTGINAAIGTASEIIWSASLPYTYNAGTAVVKVKSSDATDGSGNTGANTVLVSGLDASFNGMSETITMTGTSFSEGSRKFHRILDCRVLTAGTSGVNNGTIGVYLADESTVMAEIAGGMNNSQAAMWTVPADCYFYLTSYWANELNDEKSHTSLHYRLNGGLFQVIDQQYLRSNCVHRSFDVPIKLPAGTDIELRGTSLSDSTLFSGGFEGWTEPV